MPRRHPLRVKVALLAALAAGCLLGTGQASAHPQPQLVISQVYGGGGNSGAQYQTDFVEIFNRSGSTADLSGYSVQYAAAGSGSWSLTPLSGTLPVGRYLLVGEGSAGGGAGSPLPAADATGTIDLSATSGKVALVPSFTPLSGACPSSLGIVDLVGYGSSANCFEGAGPTSNLSNATAAVRKSAGCTDSNGNSSDFQVLAPSARNASTAANACSPIPSTPSVAATAPASPSNQLTPNVSGDPGTGSIIEIYTNPACSGAPVATGSAASFVSPGIPVPASPNGSTSFHALAHDSNNTSACSSSTVAYVNDTIAPGSPAIHTSSPASPANDAAPKILGSAPDDTTVKLFTDSLCSVGPVGSGPAAEFASTGIAAGIASNSTTTLWATATDAAGNASGCSTSSLTYVEDSTPPPAPTFSKSVPASPASDATPNIVGSADAGTTVRLYGDSLCTSLAGTGLAAQFSSSGIGVTVAPDSTTSFHATATDAAGNTSACSSATLAYVNDSTFPEAPTLTSSDPPSPANDSSPRIRGSADPGTVSLYDDPACTNPVGTGTHSEFASTGIAVTVPQDSTTTLRAKLTAGGKSSPCSTSTLVYVEDSTAPDPPALHATTPPSPGPTTTPRILGSAEPESTVTLYTDSACTSPTTSGPGAVLGSSGIPAVVPAESTTTFFGTASDAAGNTSPCSTSSITYAQLAATAQSSAPPVIGKLKVRPKRFEVSMEPTPIGTTARLDRGARVEFTLSKPARVRFTVLRSPRRPHGPGPQGSPLKAFRRLLEPGPQSVPFTGRLGDRLFTAGRWRLYAVAVDSDGNVSKSVSATFRIVEP